MSSTLTPRSSLLTADEEAKVKDALTQVHLSDDNLKAIMNLMLKEMQKGLAKATNPNAKVKMIPSYVESLPDGTEKGSFLALDLGGTNFRVLLVKIINNPGQSKPTIEMDSQIYKMPQDVIVGKGTKLFDHIAECMSDFMKRFKLNNEKLPASLITWTKGFSAEGVVGKDVVKMLSEAIKRRGDFDCDIVAVVNDTVGTLMSCAVEQNNCQIGLIVGTGSNACYMEKKSNIELIDSKEGNMVVNMEWGAFGDDGALDKFRNEYDVHVDENSLNRGKQKYEKMISGMYMGEIVRLVLCKLTKDGVLFKGINTAPLFKTGNFESSYVSQIESAISDGIPAVQNILAQLEIGAVRTDCEIVIRVCQAVSKRAAHLCAAGIAAVVRKIKQNHPNEKGYKVTVGVDGTVYKKHPTFSKLMAEKVSSLCKDVDVKVNFALSYDGSGKGAALVTAVAHRMFHTLPNGTA